MKILLVGKNSFLANAFVEQNKNIFLIEQVSHNEFFFIKDFGCYDWVLNFSLNPGFYTCPYNAELDQDYKIAMKIKSYDVKYLLLSSRTVYDNHSKFNLDESSELNYDSSRQYALNKITSEVIVSDILKEKRLLIIRLSNVFGLEVGRKTFMGVAQTNLLTKGRILLDVPSSSKRDFLPVTFFAKQLGYLILKNTIGVFNLGSGVAVTLEDICNKLIAGFGRGVLEVCPTKIDKDQFLLNTERLESITSIKIDLDDVFNYTYFLGNRLNEYYESK